MMDEDGWIYYTCSKGPQAPPENWNKDCPTEIWVPGSKRWYNIISAPLWQFGQIYRYKIVEVSEPSYAEAEADKIIGWLKREASTKRSEAADGRRALSCRAKAQSEALTIENIIHGIEKRRYRV